MVVILTRGLLQVHGEVVRIFAEGADQHLKHQEQSKHERAVAAKTGTSHLPKADPFPVPVLVDYLQKCLAATKHSRRYLACALGQSCEVSCLFGSGLSYGTDLHGSQVRCSTG